ncbi:carbon-nitrogen hydrolase family protein [Polaromonas naphthalenivorans]|jgi:nitrilase|uniref:Nitrilase n=1 Tax=Polaromonas naphthalenivorans (strain CJ2) TaxID=365044 RepID=A1VWX6_POLNA|nr:carbon-nitrogen hydrolase family protein [Polaromonas naphthalenivorans]ABM40154.1 Nitrilase [Polaromonas naphthalenivorans CJ2]
MPKFAKFKAAAVQAAPCFLDTPATMQKVGKLVREAASAGASIVVFPEVFVSGYPYWNWLKNPLDGSAWFQRLYFSAIDVPGPEVEELCRLSRDNNIHIAIGVNERGAKSVGTIYNTNLLFSPEKGLINRQRKLVPTFAEKLSWTAGDAHGLRVSETEIGPIGMLACGENTNTLARFALLAEGELLHIANFVAFPFVSSYDMPSAIKTRIGAHSFEGKVFSIVACSAMSPEIVDAIASNDEERERMSGSPNAFSAIFNPHGVIISDPLVDVEGITYADIDLAECIAPKQYHDILGHYNRFDIFSLQINRTEQSPIRYIGDATEPSGVGASEHETAPAAIPAQ